MKILVVGGTRFIGAHAVRRLHDAGADVTVFHRGRSTNPILPTVEHVVDPGAAFPISVFPETLRREWDVVVHMVAMGRADSEAAIHAFAGRTRRVVLVSSCDVYLAYGRLTGMEPGPPEAVPLPEDAPLRRVLHPYRGRETELGAYARDYEKILAEAALREARGLDWTILRLAKVYGPGDNDDLSTVYGFAAAPDWRWSHGHVANVGAAIALASTHPGARNAIYNVGEQRTATMGERLRNLPRRHDPPPDPPPFDYRQDLVVDTTRLRQGLGYSDVVDEATAMAAIAASRRCAGQAQPLGNSSPISR